MSTWLINISGSDYTPAALQLAVVGGEWVSGGPSSVTLRAARNFDAAQLFNFGATVKLKRDGTNYFQGKCRAIPKSANGGSEAQEYLIQDAWADLEKLTYQEPWAIQQADYTGAAYSPRVVLGLDSSGTRISTSGQIAEVVAFAVSMSVAIQLGSIPTGMMLWPEEQNGMSCADILRTSLRYHMDWIPWLDHTTTPPTFNVTPSGSASARTLNVSGGSKVSGFQITQTDDRVPSGVKIIYKSCHLSGDVPYRTYRIDQAPFPTGTAPQIKAALVAPAPLGMLVTEVELAGQQVQVQKQQVTVRAMPTTEAAAVAYLKLKFPIIKDVGTFTVDQWDLSVLTPSETAPTLDALLLRKTGSGLSGANGLKNELIDGAVPDWTQRRVGTVLVKLKTTPGGSMSEENKELLKSLPPWFTVTATNAVTKIYRGPSSYTPADSIPNGVAAAYLATLQAGCAYEGSITTIESDVGETRWHGAAINLSGGYSAWSTMSAPIHSVSWDLTRRKTTINFGPNPDFGLQEYIEFLRNLSKRENRTYTTEERIGSELGSETGISGRGDSVGPTMTPQTVTGGGSGGGAPPPTGAFFGLTTVSGVTYLQGGSVSAGDGTDTAANIALTNSSGVPLHSAGQHMYVNALGDGVTSDGVVLAGFNLTSATVGYASTVPSNTIPLAAGVTGKRCYIDLGVFTATGFLPNQPGNIQISYCPGGYTVSRY